MLAVRNGARACFAESHRRGLLVERGAMEVGIVGGRRPDVYEL